MDHQSDNLTVRAIFPRYTNTPLKLLTIDHATRDFDGSVVYQCSQLGHNGLPQRVEYPLERLTAYRDLVALVHDRSPSSPKPPGLSQFLSGSALGGDDVSSSPESGASGLQ
ncbi:hypothetical protein TRICI_000768 [Trichomonascus ciferrii]|uniref:Uncharacterized protein n=1 Tax=Trichomonascus ciferrii TaxID=44093 RepID=A0A642VBZ5_9ASCO|nr:hypothetical protein TRICI_000768 [Trichomonascus ciferrii]